MLQNSDESVGRAQNISFQSCRSTERGGGGKYRCNAVINIQIHYNLLFIDPQVLFINCHSILSSRHDAKIILTAAVFSWLWPVVNLLQLKKD